MELIDYINFKYYNFVKQTVTGLEPELVRTPGRKLNITANYTCSQGMSKHKAGKVTPMILLTIIFCAARSTMLT